MPINGDRALVAAGVTLAGAAAAWWLRSRGAGGRRYSFRDRVVFITGASRGLGFLIARQLAVEGAKLAICARGAPELGRAAAQLGPQVLTYPLDVADREAVQHAIEETEREHGPIDVLINNAGVIAVGPAATMEVEDYRQAMDTHFWGPLHACRAALDSMRRRREGRIVNVASIGGKISVPHLLPYCASKFALVGFSRGLRAEVARDNIVVTTVCPGLMRTGSPMNAEFKGRPKAEYAWFKFADSLPGLSMNAERAARQIVEACRLGRAEVVLTVPAMLAAKVDALMPEVTSAAMQLANRLLPSSASKARLKGRDAESEWTAHWPATLSDEAALRTNQA